MLIPKIEDILNCPKRYNSKYLKAHFLDFFNTIDKFEGRNITEKMYQYFYGTHKCPACNKKTTFLDFRRGYSQYCSYKCRANSKEQQEKTNKTNQERYGYDRPLQNKSILEKQKQTTYNKYGVYNVSQSEVIKQKKKETTLRHYGVENPMQDNIIKQKSFEILKDKYKGIGYGSPYISDKIKNTLKYRYGVDHPKKSNGILLKTINTIHNITQSKYDDFICYNGTNWICKCPHDNCKLKNECTGYYEISYHQYKDRIRLNIEPCTVLNPIGSLYKGVSDGSKKYFNKLKQYFPDLLAEYQLYKYKLDAYIPSLKTCIEYNGIYWHCKPELYSPDYYNQMVHKTAQQIWSHDKERKEYIESKGIKVITIWEDELPDPEELYKSLITR